MWILCREVAEPVSDDSCTLLTHFGSPVPARCPVPPGCPWVLLGASWVSLGASGVPHVGLLVALRVPPGCSSVTPGCLWSRLGCFLASWVPPGFLLSASDISDAHADPDEHADTYPNTVTEIYVYPPSDARVHE